jgi:phage gpG-like protein
MPDPAINVRGWSELAAGTKTLAAQIQTDADDRFAREAAAVAIVVAGAVPYVSGRLSRSATSRAGNPSVVALGNGVPYAGWIEFGGSRGRPFVPNGRYLYPSAVARTDEVVRAGEAAAETKSKGMTWPKPT